VQLVIYDLVIEENFISKTIVQQHDTVLSFALVAVQENCFA